MMLIGTKVWALEIGIWDWALGLGFEAKLDLLLRRLGLMFRIRE